MTNSDEIKDRISILNKVLYSKDKEKTFEKKRHGLKDLNEYYDVSSTWKEDGEPKKTMKITYEKFLLMAFVFFIIAFGFAFFKFFAGSNTISGDNIDILVAGPVSVAGGEEFALDIEIKNKNNVDLQTVDLRIEYPDGVRSSLDLSTEVKRFSEVVGNIKVGESKSKVVKVILFGEENAEKDIKIGVEYRIPGSNAVFSKQKDYVVVINSSPINIKIDGPEDVNTNQPVDYSVYITSNSLTTIKDLIAKIDYPFGFNVGFVEPASIVSDKSVFELGDLEPGAKRTIKIKGSMQGQDGEQRILRFTVGSSKENDKETIGTPFAIYTKDIYVKRPLVGLNISLNNNSGNEISLGSGERVLVKANWYNNLTEKLYNVVVRVKITGSSLNKNSINSSDGFYSSSQNSIIFDKNENPDFSVVSPGDQGNISFDFSSLSQSSQGGVSLSNSNIKMEFSILGSRAGNSGSLQEVFFTDTRVINISSDLKLLVNGSRNSGPFQNTGPIPPKVDNESTYTITWIATNSFNVVGNVKVSTVLSPNIKWTGNINPLGEKVTYNQDTGEVVWNIGNMKAETGIRNPARTLSFQVSVIPSVSQIGQNINLLNESIITGLDYFSGETINETRDPVTTEIISDPEYYDGMGKVVN